jgi:hypothetical protein
VIEWENDLTPYEARSVAATFLNQFNELNQQSRDIGNLLKFLSFFDPENIPVELIVHGTETLLQHRPKVSCRPIRNILQKTKKWLARKMGHTKSDAGDITAPSHLSSEFDSLITLIISPIEFQSAIQTLQNLSLVEHRSHNGTSSLWIHDLIQFMVRERAKNNETYQEWLQLSWSLVYGAFLLIKHPKAPKCWADCEEIVPHLQSLIYAWDEFHGANAKVS